MSPVTHLLASWIVAASTTESRRDCRIVTLIGLAPDLDSFGLLVDLANQWVGNSDGFTLYQRYHHSLSHGLPAALLFSLAAASLARQRLRVALLALVVFHLHLVCDLLGSRGPAPEDLWPIHYLMPISYDWTWNWRGQWRLDGWQNRVISLVFVGLALGMPPRVGHSVVGVFHRRADVVFVGVLRRWRGQWRATRPGG